jgi:hypothetical protein
MSSLKPLSGYVKIVVVLERRPDGGLRAYSDDVPGFVLSHSNQAAVLSDVKPALEGILSEMFGGKVVVAELPQLREELALAGATPSRERPIPETLEYVTHLAA